MALNKKQKQLILALGLGFLALLGNKVYLDSRISEYRDVREVSVVRAKDRIRAGTPLRDSLVEKVRVPERFAPKARIVWEKLTEYIGQEVVVDIAKGDYVLDGYFRAVGTVGNSLSEQLEGQDLRAISLPVDETNSLARSIVTGDKIDIVYTFSLPPLRQTASVVLLQNVQVIATGSYSVAEQERNAPGGSTRRYNSLTLRLNARDALRLNYARQEGSISIFLRSPRDNNVLSLSPITGVSDLLSGSEKEFVDRLKLEQEQALRVEGERFKDQVQTLMEMERKQGVSPARAAK